MPVGLWTLSTASRCSSWFPGPGVALYRSLLAGLFTVCGAHLGLWPFLAHSAMRTLRIAPIFPASHLRPTRREPPPFYLHALLHTLRTQCAQLTILVIRAGWRTRFCLQRHLYLYRDILAISVVPRPFRTPPTATGTGSQPLSIPYPSAPHFSARRLEEDVAPAHDYLPHLLRA